MEKLYILTCYRVIMFFNSTEVPQCMLQLDEAARHRALEIANALLTAGVEESKTLRIAIAVAKHLANGGTPVMTDEELDST